MTEKILEIERNGEDIVLRLKRHELPHVPEDTKGHLRIAGKETLLAIRSLLDRAIERTEEAEKGKKRKKAKIEVE